MSVEIVNAFVYLLQNERHIFKESEAKLSDFSTTLPDNVEQIANNIIAWCKEQGIYDNLCDALAHGKRGIGNSKSPTPPSQPSETSKELLINSIINNSPLSDPPPSKP